MAHGQLDEPRLQALIGRLRWLAAVGRHGVRRREQREVPVEIGTRAEMEPALTVPEKILRTADRIGHGHYSHPAAQAALPLGREQLRHQRIDRHDAGQFVAMQRRLEIGRLRRRIGPIETVDREGIADALDISGECLDLLLHGAASIAKASASPTWRLASMSQRGSRPRCWGGGQSPAFQRTLGLPRNAREMRRTAPALATPGMASPGDGWWCRCATRTRDPRITN